MKARHLSFLLALVALAVLAPAAGATVTYEGSFGSPGTGAGEFSSPNGIAIDETTGHVYVSDSTLNRIQEFTADGTFVQMWGQNDLSHPQGIAIDDSGGPASGSIYVLDAGFNRVQRFTTDGVFVSMWGRDVNQTTGGDLCTAESGDTCQPGRTSGDPKTNPPTPSNAGQFAGWADANGPNLAVDDDGYVYVGDPKAVPYARIQKFDSNGTFLSQIASRELVPGDRGLTFNTNLALDSAGNAYVLDRYIKLFTQSDFTPEGTSARYDGVFDLAADSTGQSGGATSLAVDPSNDFLLVGDTQHGGCGPSDPSGPRILEFHPSGQEVDCTPSTGPSSAMAVSSGHKLYSISGNQIRIFTTPTAEPADVSDEVATEITSSGARINAQVAANLGATTFHVEYGTAPCSANPCQATPESESIGAAFAFAPISTQLRGLAPGTDYFYRVVATNGAGVTPGADREFSTFPAPTFDPSCPNNLARQQTGAAFLLDCRAYELVSAENQGGHNVVSDLIPGQEPFAGYPLASGRALYAVDNGGIPGSGKPTNRGPDPYVATRDASSRRWRTEYVGVPADAPSAAPFSSTLAGADGSLKTFVFGGPEMCDPCFPDGSAGLPLRTGDGSLAQGMVGSNSIADPEPAGEVRKHLSEDGSHLIFSSEQQFEPAGNPDNGNVTVYDRNLASGTTQVASTLPDGSTMEAGDDVVALDVSSDGSRVLIGRRVSTDSEGNDYFDLYMHVGDSPNSVEVADTPNGVLYGGMTSDGGQVVFTTVDPLDDDTDSSADLFRATIGGTTSVTRVSTGESGTGDTDVCDPSANSFNPQNWNVVPGGPTDCSVVAVGGGDGVASEEGSVYFLSPEQLDGSGVAGAPNLFVARPGEGPHFVATLESSANEPLKPGVATFKRYAGTFSNPAGAALDRATGSFYVYDVGTQAFPGGPGGKVQKFTAGGTPDASFAGDSVLSGADGPNSNFYVMGSGFPPVLPGLPTQIAVDNSGGPNSGDLYVTDLSGSVKRFSSSGNYELTIPVGPGIGSFSFITGVAVQPVTGDVYASYLNGFTSESTILAYDENGAPTGTSITKPGIFLGVAVDSNSNVYAATGGEVLKYDAGGSLIGTFDPGPSKGVAVDPGALGDTGDDLVYVDRGDHVIPYTPGGDQGGSALGAGIVSGSISLATDAASLVVTNPDSENVAVFRPMIPKEPAYDNPLVIESVQDSAGNGGDQFQVTPDGRYAVFATTLPVKGFDSAGHYELARYDSAGESLECVSCNPTRTEPSADARLASNGLSITHDGRVFFTSGEPLVLRDTNQKLDAYEWSSGHIELISTGQSPFDSGLLSVTADGTDAFFFTREKLASNDENGNLMKLYTAHEGGGSFVIPPTPPCAASDECHGPSSQAAPPVELGTAGGTGGNATRRVACRKGRVKRGGKCVKPRKHGKHRSKPKSSPHR